MVFSSITFLYVFLPILLLIYFIIPKRFKNTFLLISSLLFYFYGEPKYLYLIILSSIINFLFGLWISKNKKPKYRKIILIFGLIFDFGLLFYFKYFNFFLDTVSKIFKVNVLLFDIALPLGISFYTFQASSYIIDVYRNKIEPTKNILHFTTYLTLFPQLIAGPIIRYETVSDELKMRTTNLEDFATGIKRFIIGLSKKVLLANQLGYLVSILTNMNNPSILSYFIIGLSQTLQIYLDFSGYSDMAIGLGNMFGFHFLENFDYPFISKSITEFWRRWHMTLSQWIRDYIYIPLGGNRVGVIRNIINILAAWLFTGLWHKASWNFILWGIYFAVFLILEKKFLLKKLNNHPLVAHIYTCIIIYISFIIFNTENISEILQFLKNILGFGNLAFTNIETNFYLSNFVVLILISILTSTPIIKAISTHLKKKKYLNTFLEISELLALIFFLILSTSSIISGTFNPFLYFRF